LDGWIEDAGGNKIRSLKKDEITDRSEFSNSSLYEDNFIKSFELKHNTYPYTICYTYKISINQFITVDDWSPALYARIPTREARVVVVLPKDYPTEKYLRNVKLVKSDTADNKISTVYSSEYRQIDHNETNAQNFEDFKPRLIIVAQHFNYGINGSTSDWKSYGNWFFNLNKGLDDLPASEKEIVSQLIKGVTDTNEVIKILYHYVQDHTRYINVSIGIGGFKAYPASYVAQNKYGDCKALTNYMKALLEFAGIKSYSVLINRSLIPEKIIADLPFPQFNHVLLAVPLKQDTIWLENTENSEAFNYVGATIQNRKALWVDEDASKLISMPALKDKDVELYRNIRITFDNQGNGKAKTLFRFKGFYYEQFNDLDAHYNKDEQDNIVKEYMPFTNYEVIDWKLVKSERDSAKIELASGISLMKMMKQVGADYYFNTLPIRTGLFVPPSDRKLPLFFPFPVSSIDSVSYVIPDGLQVKSVPKDQSLTTPFGNFSVHITFDDKTIHATKKFEIHANEYPIEQYQLFYDFYKSVREIEKNLILLNKKNSL
jgi:transglutaminase-like putative cysteine protease